MFIDITRYGGRRVLRVAVAAIAYLDEVESGTAVHLVGGETIRTNEDVTEIETRCAPAPAISAIQQDRRQIEDASPNPIATDIDQTEIVPVDRRAAHVVERRDVEAYPAKRTGRGRSGR